MRLSMANSAVGGWCALLDVGEKISSGRVDVNIYEASLGQRIGLYPSAGPAPINFKSSP
jgi:hypothetical protein